MKVIKIYNRFGEFAEDKDKAKALRTQIMKPELKKGNSIVLDFENVDNATQSFTHALLSQLIREFGVDVLDSIEFRNCNSTLQTIIGIVIEYMQDSIDIEDDEDYDR